MMVEAQDQAGEYAWKSLRDTLLYTLKRVPEIADDVINIDNAMKWGFNWEIGPFEMFDAIGVANFVKRAEQDGITVPESLQQVEEKPKESVVASASIEPVPSSELRFVPGSYRFEPIAHESECKDLRFEEIDIDETSGKGYWRHPQARGEVIYRIDDGIVSVDFKGTVIQSAEDTVQIKGNDLFVRLRIRYSGGICKIAYYLRDIMASN